MIHMTLKKTMFAKILVAVDGSHASKNAVKYAVRLACNYNADITFVNVVDLSSIFQILPSKTKKHLASIGRQESRKILDSAKKMAQQSHIDAKTESIESSTSAGNAIIEYAKNKKIDLIVIGAGQKSKMVKVMLGSVASRIASHAPCSTLIIR
jgi:nucleotide-binding universal stress UspA family protein